MKRKLNLVPLLALLLIGFIPLVVVLGCASFPGKELPTYAYENIVVPPEKISVSYDVKELSLGVDSANGARIVQEEVEKMLKASPLFAQVVPGVGLGEYQYSFTLRNDGNAGLSALSGFISGLTLTIIPAYAKDEYTLIVEVKKGDQVLKTYTYRDHMDTWTQLFLVFIMPWHWAGNTSREVIDTMLMSFLHDLSLDLSPGAS